MLNVLNFPVWFLNYLLTFITYLLHAYMLTYLHKLRSLVWHMSCTCLLTNRPCCIFLFTIPVIKTSILNFYYILVENHYRQAIPLAIVQADTLATAKQPPNADKTNATVNGTQGNSTEKNRENSLLHKSIGLQDASPLATPSKAVWRVDQQSLPNFDSSSNQEATDQKEITAEETKNEAESYEGLNFEMLTWFHLFSCLWFYFTNSPIYWQNKWVVFAKQ